MKRIVPFVAAAGVMVLAMGSISARAQEDGDGPSDPGAEAVVRVCSSCHAPDVVVGMHRDRAGWEELVGQMQDRGAIMSDKDKELIVVFLTTNLGVDAQPGAEGGAADEGHEGH